MNVNGLNVTIWRLEMDGPRAVALLPVWVRDLASRWHWRLDARRNRVVSESGVRLSDLVLNAPAGSEVTVDYELSRGGRLGVWDWRTVELVRRSGPGFCLSRYRYVYREPSGAWGLWLPVEGALRYFGAFADEDEAGRAANYLGPRWCGVAFQGETVFRALDQRQAHSPAPVRPATPVVASACPALGREPRAWIEWADGRVEFVDP